MLDRLDREGLLGSIRYTGVDEDADNIAQARIRAERLGLNAAQIRFVQADIFEFLDSSEIHVDLLIAHAFLDLINLDVDLPVLLDPLAPAGWCYFTLNFDGTTAFEPVLDPGFEFDVIEAYHQTMDERRVSGRSSAGRYSGRKLLAALQKQGLRLLQAGSSDWIVYPTSSGTYLADEAYFLNCMLHFFESSLTGRAGLDPDKFRDWLSARRFQIDRGQLIFLAHQIDVLAEVLG